MATTITTGKPLCYRDGVSGASFVVGYESKLNRVVRYEFRTDASGASDISVSIPNLGAGAGSTSASLRYYIGTSPTSHANAGANSEYLGGLAMTTAGGYYNFTGDAYVILKPNTTYYLWIFPGSTTFGWWYVPSTGTATITVHTAAMSNFTIGNGTLGQTVPITITRYGSFTHALYYRYGANDWVQFASGVETSYVWTPPLSLAAYAPSNTSFALTILCRTYSSDGPVGEVSKPITLTIPDTVRPSVQMTFSDPKGYASKYGGYVQGQSGVQVVLTEKTAYGSPISSRRITIGNVSSNSSSFTLQTITATGTVLISAGVTDSRGRSGTAGLDITVLPYASPTASVSGVRCDADGTPNPAGAYILATYSGSYTALNGKNTAHPKLYYRKSGASSWISIDVGLSGSSVVTADPGYIYELQYKVQDDFSSQPSQIFPVPSAYVGMSMAKNADGVIDAITFGGTAHPGGGFVCEMLAHFAKTAHFEGRIVPKKGMNCLRYSKSYTDTTEDNFNAYLTNALKENRIDDYVLIPITFAVHPAISGATFYGFVGVHYDLSYGSLFAWSYSGEIVKKDIRAGVWQPTEWVTPLVGEGAETRTTERYMGKPVYIKMINCGAMPAANTTKKIAHGCANVKDIVAYGGCMDTSATGTKAIALPYHFASDNYAHLSVDYTNIWLVTGATSLTAYTHTTVWLKYTKTT